MRALTLVFAIGLAVATTADSALAQNTLLLGRGQPPRQTTVPLTTNPNYGNRPSGQFFAPVRKTRSRRAVFFQRVNFWATCYLRACVRKRHLVPTNRL
jgi:hypothetical protein